MAKKTKLKKAKANTKNPSTKKRKPTHLQCKCSTKSGGVKIFKNARKNPSGKMGFMGKCDVYTKPNGDVIVIPPTVNPAKKVKKVVSKKTAKKKPTKPNANKKLSIKKWMQDLDIKKGSLREYVADTFGEGGFETSKKSGNKIIKAEVLKKIAGDKSLPEKRQREAQLAIKFNAARKGKKK